MRSMTVEIRRSQSAATVDHGFVLEELLWTELLLVAAPLLVP